MSDCQTAYKQVSQKPSPSLSIKTKEIVLEMLVCSLYTYIYIYRHTHTYIFTDPSSTQFGLNLEFVMKRAKLQYAIRSNK